MSVDEAQAVVAAGGFFSPSMMFLPLLWIGVGGVFLLIALRDSDRRPPAKRTRSAVSHLPPASHPLHNIHTALVTSKQAARRKAKAARATGEAPEPPEPPAAARPGRPRQRTHLRQVR